ncbi:hypothetical protein [Marisediminicola sp. LYQ85]
MSRLAIVATLAVAASLTLSGCGVAENALNGAISEARASVDDAVSEALGGAGISTDGELPSGFPVDDVPLTGDIVGGGAGPQSSGWVVQTRLADIAAFAEVQATLEGAGFESSAVSSDEEAGFGTFTSGAHTVVLAVATGSDGVVTATYAVTRA